MKVIVIEPRRVRELLRSSVAYALPDLVHNNKNGGGTHDTTS